MAENYEAIVIGGGHNGLTAAGYLGKAGIKTLVLERRAVVGGAAVTEEFHPGYRNSIASYTMGILRSEVIRDLELKRHGLRTTPYRGSLELMNDGRAILFTGEEARDQATIGQFSNRDYAAAKRLRAQLLRVGDIIRDQWLRPPPDLAGGWEAIFSSLGTVNKLRKLALEDRLFLAQAFTMSAHDFFSRWFESPVMKTIYAVHCVSSNFSSLHQPGSAVPYFLNVLGELDGVRYKWGIPKGGMGAITQAMAAFCREQGVEIRTAAPVSRIVMDVDRARNGGRATNGDRAMNRGRAVGVRLESGEEIRARVVLANTDPKRTFLGFVGREHLDPEFADHIERLRMGHASLRMNLALKGAPKIASLSASDSDFALGCAITMIADPATVERCYQAARLGEMPERPYINMQLASALDPDLAPPGHHVMSLLCKYYPYRLSGGRNWDAIKEQVADSILAAVEEHMPGLSALVVGRQVLSPLDLERVFGLTEGDIFHGRHDLDQIFSLRPHPRAARYATPVAGLYLCGSGAHPGGGVSGAPGHNAAKRVIRDLKRRAA